MAVGTRHDETVPVLAVPAGAEGDQPLRLRGSVRGDDVEAPPVLRR